MRAQKALMRIFIPAEALTSILTTRSMAASALCELASATWRCWLLDCPYPASMRVHACSKPVVSISRLPTGAFAGSNLKVLKIR